MIAQDVQDYLQSLAGQWQYPADTVDTFKAGDPTAKVRGIAVGWMSYTWALQRALELDCNVFITHEPTYYNHWDNDPALFRFPGAREKRRFIEDNELVIIRCHDLWDQIPDIGIPDSWGKLLDLGRPVDSSTYIRIYDAGGVTAGELAQGTCRAPYRHLWTARRAIDRIIGQSRSSHQYRHRRDNALFGLRRALRD